MVNRVRIRFRKQADLRLTSHRDMMRAVERLLRRADIAVCQSEGFHPKPRIHYPASLALGMTGLDEVLEADLVEPLSPPELLARLNQHSLPGLDFIAVEPLSPQGKKGQACRLRFEVTLANEQVESVREKAALLMAAPAQVIERDGKPLDIRPLVEALSIDEGVLAMRLRVVNEAGARPRDVLAALGFSTDEVLDMAISRTEVQLAPE